ncbi:MAG TPA: hypothetical protein VGX92_03295 [Pyrinomonadaceae bacterium]|jgi:hypothetical protein|nr:hypothetical protein [Pyrinomonadaceae bacterium]
MLFSIAAMLPLISSSAHNNETASASSRKGSLRRHSRAWWKRYRARQRRRRAALERKRALAGLRQRNADRQTRGGGDNNMAQSNPLSAALWLDNDSRSQSTPAVSTEHSSRRLPTVIEKGVRLNTPDGRTVGQVSVSIVGNAVAGVNGTRAAQRRALGGMPFASLRRTVIDRMLAAGGWVVNDFERDINGRRVYVVLAQTSRANDLRAPEQSWTFYFTEVEGRIYNIVSNAPLEFSDRLSLEAERVIATLGVDQRPAGKPAAAAAAQQQR